MQQGRTSSSSVGSWPWRHQRQKSQHHPPTSPSLTRVIFPSGSLPWFSSFLLVLLPPGLALLLYLSQEQGQVITVGSKQQLHHHQPGLHRDEPPYELLFQTLAPSPEELPQAGSFSQEGALEQSTYFLLFPECRALKSWLREGGDRTAGSAQGIRREEVSCWSKAEWKCWGGIHITPSASLLQALGHQRRKLKICREMEDLRNSSVVQHLARGQPTRCKYLIWYQKGGLGNKMLSLVSSLAYALLTQRVLLVGSSQGSPAHLLCEGFPGEEEVLHKTKAVTWSFPYSQKLVATAQKQRGRTRSTCQRMRRVAPSVYVMKTKARDNREVLFCEEFHDWLSASSVVINIGNTYYLPSLYTSMRFQQQLDIFFPDGRPFATLLNLLMKPKNTAWEGATRKMLELESMRVVLRVGIQHRKWAKTNKGVAKSRDDFKASSLEMAEHVEARIQSLSARWKEGSRESNCSRGEKDATDLRERQRGEASSASLNNSCPVLFMVASLDASAGDLVQKAMVESGINSNTVFFTSDRSQENFNNQHSSRALTEVLILGSMSDLLFTSGSSTFGYLMRGLSRAPAMVRDKGFVPMPEEACYLSAPKFVRCCRTENETNVTDLFLFSPCPGNPDGIVLRERIAEQ